MHKSRYQFPVPYSLPETVCHQPHMGYLYHRATIAVYNCKSIIRQIMRVDHVHRYEVRGTRKTDQ